MDEILKQLLSRVSTRKPIPGLSVETLIPVFVQGEFGDKINSIEDPSAQAEYRASLTAVYSTGNGRKSLEDAISDMEHSYSVASTVISSLGVSAPLVPVLATIPAVTTGLPNPLWNTPNTQILKGLLESQAQFGREALTQLLEKALLFHYDISAVILPLLGIVEAAEQTIKLL